MARSDSVCTGSARSHFPSKCGRPEWAGGLYDREEPARLALLQKAVDLGASFVDVELEVSNVQIILYTGDVIMMNPCLAPASYVYFAVYGSTGVCNLASRTAGLQSSSLQSV